MGDEMFKELARGVVAHPWLTCAFWLAATLLLCQFAPRFQVVPVENEKQLFATASSERAQDLFERAFPSEVAANQLLIVVERVDQRLHASDAALAERLAADVQRRLKRVNISAGAVTRSESADKQCLLIEFALPPVSPAERVDAVRRARQLAEEYQASASGLAST
jgi:uncharacterized membrane protein YdfJ with MMPL/SSD domain